MIHDRWEDVLFLHWGVPPGSAIDQTLAADAAPFVLDRYDGSAWIGLVLLTERNVGPSICRRRWTCVTHHGINVRTYVTGGVARSSSTAAAAADEATSAPGGIHFTSLECDDAFTAFGANFFGMPYKVARMERSHRYVYDDDGEQDDEKQDDGDNYRERQTGSDTTMGTAEKDPSTSEKHRERRCKIFYNIRSERTMAMPSLPYAAISTSSYIVRGMFDAIRNVSSLLWPILLLFRSKATSFATADAKDIDNALGRKRIENNNNESGAKKTETDDDGESSSITLSSSGQRPFFVDCSWSLRVRAKPSPPPEERRDAAVSASAADGGDRDGEKEQESFHHWSAERYFAYTHKYGINWRGRVDHEPWPLVLDDDPGENMSNDERDDLEDSSVVRLERLEIAGIDAYEPRSARPILRHLAERRPDRVTFSRGVGPVGFAMLQPIR